MLEVLTLLVLSLPNVLVAQQPFVREVALRVDTISVTSTRKLISSGVREGASTDRFVAFVSDGALWTVSRDLRVAASLPREGFPARANHFSSPCSAGNRILVQVSEYPDSIREKDAATPRGGFRAGPTPVGVAVLSETGMRFIKSFRVDGYWPGVRPTFPDTTLPTVLEPMVQSCHWTGSALVVGAYGFAATLDLDRETATLLTLDGELGFNRHAVHLAGDTLWTSEDEGGASGGCVERQVRGRASDRFCVMGYNNSELGVDGLLSTRFGLISSSAAGIVEIRPSDSSYTHYQLSSVKTQMSTFGARCARTALVGLRDDGIVIAELVSRRAKLVRIDNGTVGAAYAVERVGPNWLIGTDSGVFTVRLPVPGWRPWRRAIC